MTLGSPLVRVRLAGFMCRPIGASAQASPAATGGTRICYKLPMHSTGVQHLLPIASVVAGVFLLVAPRIVSFAVAVYLIFVGLLGLNGIYHIVK
jgi:hypothetical protein